VTLDGDADRHADLSTLVLSGTNHASRLMVRVQSHGRGPTAFTGFIDVGAGGLGHLVVQGTLSANVRSQGPLGSVQAGSIRNATVSSAAGIDRLRTGQLIDSSILAGLDTVDGVAGNADDVLGAGTLGFVRVLRNLERSNLIAGVSAGLDGQFGTLDDVPESLPAQSLIRSVSARSIRGSSDPTESFGILAADGSPRVLAHGRIFTGAGNLRLLGPVPPPVSPPADTQSPVIAASLVRDTAPGGGTNEDRITFDPSIHGTVIDPSPIAALRAGFDGTPANQFVDVLAPLEPNGSFTLDRGLLDQINGAALADGGHVLHIQATDSAGNESSLFDVAFELDTTPPTAPSFDLAPASDSDPIGDRQTLFSIVTLEGITAPGMAVDLFRGNVPIASSTADGGGTFTFTGVALSLGANIFTVRATDLAGNESQTSVTITRNTPPNGIVAASIQQISPANGEEMVSVSRESIVRFDKPIQPSSVTPDSFFLIANGVRIPGSIRVSSTKMFASFFQTNPLPPSAEVRIVVKGDAILGIDGLPIDADGDGAPGGTAIASFRTLPLTRIPGTNVSGTVVDAFNRNPDGSEIPIVGATIRVDGFPEMNVLTDAEGKFTLVDAPAPVFFVHIDGSTATNLPPGTTYPSVGKPFMSVAGQSTQMSMNGVPFDIYLPRVSLGDVQQLSPTETTNVGFGAAGKAQLELMFPNLDPSLWDLMQVGFAPGTAIDDFGNAATQAVIVPVPPTNLPGPLLPGQSPKLVISIQPLGANNFDVPVPVTFPNLDGQLPGEQSLIWSYNHDAGRWEVQGTGTVSADGRMIVSDPGMGILAPGWHFSQPGTCAGSGGAPPVQPAATSSSQQGIGTLSETESNVFLPLLTGESGVFPALVFNAPGDGMPDPTEGCDVPEHDPTPDETLTVDIQIDGPLEKYMTESEESTEVIASNTFTLIGDSGEQRVFALKALTLKEVAAGLGAPGDGQVGALNENVLFGSRITVTETTTHADGSMERKTTHYYLYRFIDATDANHTDKAIEFEDTLVGVTRSKPIRINTGSAATPNLFATSLPFSVSGGTMTFAPSTPGENQETQLLVQAPTGDLVGSLTMRGDGEGRQKYLVNVGNVNDPTSFVAQARILFETNVMNNAEKQLFRDMNQSNLVFDPERARLLAEAAVSKAEQLMSPFSSGLERVISDDGETAVVGSFEAGGADRASGETAGPLDNATGIYSVQDLRLNRNKYSQAERAFRLSEALNERPAAEISVFLPNFFTAHHKDLRTFTFDTLVFALGKTIAHEIGHALGLAHTNAFDLGKLEVMTQYDNTSHYDDQGYDRFDVTKNAFKIATGLDWTAAEAEQAIDYFTSWINGGSLEGLPGGPGDENHGDPSPIHDGLLWVRDDPSGAYIDSINFGNSDVNAGPSTRQFLLSNLGEEPATLGDLLIKGGGPFTISGLSSGQVIPALSQVSFTVSFDPTTTGAASGSLAIANDGLDVQVDVTLSGFGQTSTPHATVVDLDNNLGGVLVASGSSSTDSLAVISNHGLQALQITAVRLVSGQGRFTLSQLPDFSAGPVTLAFGDTFTFGATFDAAGVGLDRAIIEIDTNDPTQPVVRLSAVGTGLDSIAYPKWGSDFVTVETTLGGDPLVLRTRSNLVGDFTMSLPPNERFAMTMFDPDTGLVAHSFGKSPRSGLGTDLTSSLVFRASIAKDSDFDGLPDDIELAVASNPQVIDTDADGLDDFTEVTQGLDPSDGVAPPAGLVSSVGLFGPAQDVAVVGQLAYVATGTYGLAIVDLSQPKIPIVLGQLALAGGTVDVDVDSALGIAAVASNTAGLHLVDVSDPMQPALITSLDITASRVVVDQGTAYVSTGEDLVIVDLKTATVVQELIGIAGFFPISGMAVDAGFLYTYAISPGKLTVIDVTLQGFARVRSTLAIDPAVFGGSDLVVDDGVAFIVAGGLKTIDVTNADSPALISDALTTFSTGNGVALGGSGLLLSPFKSQNQDGLRLIDVSDPQNTGVSLGTIDLPGHTLDVKVGSGLAFVAADTAGLLVVNFAGFDSAGSPPTVTISSPIADADPVAPGQQILEGSTIPLSLVMLDDVQVARVELLVNGQVAGVFRDPPYDLSAIAPLIAPGVTSVTVQLRSVDTGGNSGLSNGLSFQLLEDTTRPTVNASDPVAGGVLRRDWIRVAFNEAINPALLQSGGVIFTNLGTNGVLGGGDDTIVTGLVVETRSDDRVLFIQKPDGLPNGKYQLTLSPSAIADRAGNTLASPYVLAFERQPQIGDIAFDQVIMGSITQAGERAMFTFQGTAGTRILYDSLIPRTPGGDDLEMRILGPTGQSIISNIIGSDTDQGPRTLPETGTYTIIIDENADSVGDFAFRIVNISAAPLISFGEQIGGNVTLEADVYRFNGSANQMVLFDFLPGTTFAGGGLDLYRPNNALNRFLVFDENGDELRTLPDSGEYVLIFHTTLKITDPIVASSYSFRLVVS
jgi:hypothetical protein